MKKSTKIWLAISGILLVALGILCICKPAETLFATAWMIGCFTLFSGITKLIFTFRTQKFLPNSASRLVSAILQILLGIIFLANNFFVALSLPLVFIAWILAESIIIAIQSFDYKKIGFPGWWAILLLGLGGIALGILGMRNPDVTATTLSTLIGLAICMMGLGYLVALTGVQRFENKVNELGKVIDQQ
jgi:uncharacterized membrane protein HdeD (DUF308 family)